MNIVNKTTEAALDTTERFTLEEDAEITEMAISSQACSRELEYEGHRTISSEL
jgi:hypothetical protein